MFSISCTNNTRQCIDPPGSSLPLSHKQLHPRNPKLRRCPRNTCPHDAPRGSIHSSTEASSIDCRYSWQPPRGTPPASMRPVHYRVRGAHARRQTRVVRCPRGPLSPRGPHWHARAHPGPLMFSRSRGRQEGAVRRGRCHVAAICTFGPARPRRTCVSAAHGCIWLLGSGRPYKRCWRACAPAVPACTLCPCVREPTARRDDPRRCTRLGGPRGHRVHVALAVPRPHDARGYPEPVQAHQLGLFDERARVVPQHHEGDGPVLL